MHLATPIVHGGLATDAPGSSRQGARAAGSIKTKSSQKFVRVSAGGSRAPYYPWLDFGGQIGARSGKARGNRGRRPFIKDGRYLYASYFANREQFVEVLRKSLVKVATDAGIGVD